MIGRLQHLIIDCPDRQTLAAFYAELTGLAITRADADSVVIATNDTSSGIASAAASDSRVYADPAGHPCCLRPRPVWAVPISAAPGARQPDERAGRG